MAIMLGWLNPLSAQRNLPRFQALVTQADSATLRESTADAQRAIRLYHQALAAAGPTPEAWVLVRVYPFLAHAFIGFGMPDSALYYHRKLVPYLKDPDDLKLLAFVYEDVAGLHVKAARSDSAIVNLKTAVALGRRAGGSRRPAGLQFLLGLVFGKANQPDSARLAMHGTLLLSRQSGEVDIEAHALLAIGRYWLSAEHRRGDSALFYLRKSLEAHDRAGLSAVRARPLTLMAGYFADVFLPDSALFYGRQALSSLPVSEESLERLEATRKLSTIFNQLGRRDSALVYGRAMVASARRTRDQILLADVLADWGSRWMVHNRDTASAAFKEALDLYRQASHPLGLARVHAAFGWSFLGAKQADSALVHLQASRVEYQRAGIGEDWAVPQGIALAYYQRGQADSASRYFDLGYALRSRERRHAGDDFVKLAVAEYGTREFELLWTNAWLLQAPRIGNLQAALGALEATERVRSQVLGDLLGVLNPSELAESVAKQTATDPGVWDPGSFPAQAKDLLDRTLVRADAVLYYLVGPDVMTVWAASKGGPPVVTQVRVRRDTLANAIAGYLQSLAVQQGALRMTSRSAPLERGALGAASAHTESSSDAAKRLAGWVFPAELSATIAKARDVVIIPHGILGQLPFGTLPDPVEAAPIGTVRALRFAPSLRILESATRSPVAWRTKADLGSKAVIVGNPSMPLAPASDGARAPLSPLPGAQLESADVAGRIGMEALVGPAASETIVRRRLAGAPLVHLATHGFSYSRATEAGRSFVALAPDSVSDGLLTMTEVLNAPELKLSADLVVLSACQTGLGNLREAEGTVGLQRAFLARGARSLLVSLWNVSDEATRLLMDRFYQHWLDDPDHPGKAEALRRAQVEVRKTKGFEHPRFWAAFQLVGAN